MDSPLEEGGADAVDLQPFPTRTNLLVRILYELRMLSNSVGGEILGLPAGSGESGTPVVPPLEGSQSALMLAAELPAIGEVTTREVEL